MVTLTRTPPPSKTGSGYYSFTDVFDVTQYPAGERHVRVAENIDLLAVKVIETTAKTFDDLQLRHFGQAEVVRRFDEAGLFANDPIVVIPDAGAAKKAYSWLDGRTVVQALKRRDVRTGALSGFEVLADDLGGRPCIIIDDICDGGGTFLGLAAELQKANAGPLTLAVTHGLFTKGTDRLLEAFATVACLSPTGSDPAPGVTAIPFSELYAQGETT